MVTRSAPFSSQIALLLYGKHFREKHLLAPKVLIANILVKKCTNKFDCLVYEMFFINELRPSLNVQSDSIRGTQRQFSENICSEDDLRSRIFGAFVVKFLARLPLLDFSNI